MQRIHMLSSQTVLKLIEAAHRDLHLEQDTPQDRPHVEKSKNA